MNVTFLDSNTCSFAFSVSIVRSSKVTALGLSWRVSNPLRRDWSNLKTTGEGGAVLFCSVNLAYSSPAFTAPTELSILDCISWHLNINTKLARVKLLTTRNHSNYVQTLTWISSHAGNTITSDRHGCMPSELLVGWVSTCPPYLLGRPVGVPEAPVAKSSSCPSRTHWLHTIGARTRCGSGEVCGTISGRELRSSHWMNFILSNKKTLTSLA